VSRSHQSERLIRLACHGGCRADAATRGHHDQLLRVETDPDAIIELFDVAVTWRELEYPAEAMIPPDRWLEFADRHRWQEPERITRIFGLATDIALRATPVAADTEYAMAAGSGLCPVLNPAQSAARFPRLTIAGR
jgi:hypothetical protein